jgi:hypothetical protein
LHGVARSVKRRKVVDADLFAFHITFRLPVKKINHE